MTESNLPFPAVFCENLRFAAKICENPAPSTCWKFQGEGVNLRKSAVFCENLSFGLSLSGSVSLSVPRYLPKFLPISFFRRVSGGILFREYCFGGGNSLSLTEFWGKLGEFALAHK